MEWNDGIDLSKRKFTSRLIVQRALARSWKIRGFETNPAVFLLYIPGRSKPVKIFSASPPQASYVASLITKDKYITNQILADENLPVPNEMLVDLRHPPSEDELKAFLQAHNKVVVKPLDASHGNGITVNVQSVDELKEALAEAKQQSANPTILIQEQLEGVDIRIVCLNYKFLDAISRIPACVIGDGRHTVDELITITNNSGERAENYKSRLNVIPQSRAKRYLGAQIQDIPKKGQKVQVMGISNIGTGGVRKNIKEQIPETLKVLACKVAQTLELPVCGVDFMVSRLPKATDSLETLQPRIIEANECPMLTMYDDLNSPEQAKLIDAYLDYVADIDKSRYK